MYISCAAIKPILHFDCCETSKLSIFRLWQASEHLESKTLTAEERLEILCLWQRGRGHASM